MEIDFEHDIGYVCGKCYLPILNPIFNKEDDNYYHEECKND